jgi:hypothetical protein
VTCRHDKALRRLFVVAVLAMIVVGVRLNQHEAISSAKREVLKSTYREDVESREDRVAACVRGRADRVVQREGWRTARRRAALAAADAATAQQRAFQLGARKTYSHLVSSLSKRIEPLDCKTANPMPVPPPGVRLPR